MTGGKKPISAPSVSAAPSSLMVWFKASHRAHIVRVPDLSIINKGLYLPPNGRITLTSETTAILLTRLRQSLQPEWQPYEAVLTFEQAGDIAAQFTVIRNSARPLMRLKKPPQCCPNSMAKAGMR